MPLELVELTQHYGRRVALERVSLVLRPGECYGLVGPNGAGKTTLLRQALLLQRSQAGGRVLVDGFDAWRHPREALARVAGTVEVGGHWGALSGRRHLALAGRLAGLAPAAARERAEELLQGLGIQSAAHEPVRRWSQGMRQRLGLAHALVGRPRYLLLDEPTNALDPEGIRDLRTLLLEQVREHGLGLLVSSHQLAEVGEWCDRVGFLRTGALVLEVDRAELERRARGRTFVRTEDDARAAELCAEQGFVTTASARGGMLVQTKLRGGRALAELFVGARIGLDELTPARTSLEDIYLEIAGGLHVATPGAKGASLPSVRGPPHERRAPSFPSLRVLAHELARACARPGLFAGMLLPSILAVLAALHSAAADARALAELGQGELYSATSASAFALLAAALQAGLPLLALLSVGTASQMLAAEIGRGTHRLLLVQPIGRRAIVCGKLAAVMLYLGAGALALAASSLLVATWKADFGDVVEILPNGKSFPLVAQAEIWPALLASLPSLALALCALTALGFLASACLRSASSALALALSSFALLDLARAPLRTAGLEAWVPTTYLPSPLGDRSLLAGFADLAQGVSNPATAYLATAELVPLAWCAAALAFSLLIWMRRSFP